MTISQISFCVWRNYNYEKTDEITWQRLQNCTPESAFNNSFYWHLSISISLILKNLHGSWREKKRSKIPLIPCTRFHHFPPTSFLPLTAKPLRESYTHLSVPITSLQPNAKQTHHDSTTQRHHQKTWNVCLSFTHSCTHNAMHRSWHIKGRKVVCNS